MDWQKIVPTKSDFRITWWVIFIYVFIYIALSVLKGIWGVSWPTIEQVWLLLGYVLSIGVVYAAYLNMTPRELKSSWFWILLAILCLAIGGVLRTFIKGSNITQPHLIFLKDIFFLVGTPLFWIGVLRFPSRPRQNVTRLRSLFDFALSIFAFSILVIAMMIRPFYSIFQSDIWKAISLLIVLMDVITIILLIFLFLVTEVKTVSLSKAWLGCGIVTYMISNLIFAFSAMGDIYVINGVEDLGRVLGNTFVMLGAITEVFSPIEWPKQMVRFLRSTLSRLQMYLPLIMGFLLCLFVFFDNQINIFAFWGTVIIALGLIARQGLQVGEEEMQKYADLVIHIAEPTFICDPGGRLQLVNPALANLVGYASEAELLGNSIFNLFNLPAETKTMLEVDLELGWSGELDLKKTDGSQARVLLSLRPLSSNFTGKLAIAGSAHDLTDQKKQQLALQQAYEQIATDRSELEKMNVHLEKMVAEKTQDLMQAYRQLEAQNQTLQQLDQMKSDFVGMVSHELRAPLTNIHGGIELLQRIKPLPERVEENLRLVQSETRRLTRFVETILDLTALDAGRMPFYPAPVSMQYILQVLHQLFTYSPDTERVIIEFPTDLPYVLADDQALTSIIFHLVDNAIKYATGGDIHVTAGVEQGKRLWVQVKDEGPGIELEALPHLFQRFYRANSDAQTVYGHGLGLYIVRRMLEAMDGTIEARNNPDKGACFTFWLPLAEEKEGLDA